MNEKVLMKWGGICAFAFVVLFIVWAAMLWITQGIPSQMPTVSDWADTLAGSVSRISVILFSIFMCFYVVVAYATYDYLRKTSYGLSRIGFGFAVLWIITVFIVTSIFAAGKIIVLSGAPGFEAQLFAIMALAGGLHIYAIWFWALFPFLWGMAFVKLEGKNKIVGILFLVVAFLAVLYYAFLRAGNIWIAEFTHLLGHIAFIVSHFFLAMVLIAASKES